MKNLTDLERELDAACGGKSLDRLKDSEAKIFWDMRLLLRDCHKLLSSYVGATYRPKKLAEWEKKRVELMERIESAVKQ